MVAPVKLFREVPLFKRVIQHHSLDEHVEELVFQRPVCITGIKIGSVPGEAHAGASPSVHIFAQDSSALLTGRLCVLCEDCPIPDTGTRAVRIEAVATTYVVLRGKYKTLPVALYGYSLGEVNGKQVSANQLVVDPSLLVGVGDLAGMRFHNQGRGVGLSGCSDHLTGHPRDPPASLMPVLEDLIDSWNSLKNNDRRLLSCEAVPDMEQLLAIANRICRHDSVAEDAIHMSPEQQAALLEALDALADMAVYCCALLIQQGLARQPGLQYGTLGLAAAVLATFYPRSAARFLFQHGVGALHGVLDNPRLPLGMLKHAVKALELLVGNCGAAACEAMLGWWQPSLMQTAADDQIVPAATEDAALSSKVKKEKEVHDSEPPATAGPALAEQAQEAAHRFQEGGEDEEHAEGAEGTEVERHVDEDAPEGEVYDEQGYHGGHAAEAIDFEGEEDDAYYAQQYQHGHETYEHPDDDGGADEREYGDDEDDVGQPHATGDNNIADAEEPGSQEHQREDDEVIADDRDLRGGDDEILHEGLDEHEEEQDDAEQTQQTHELDVGEDAVQFEDSQERDMEHAEQMAEGNEDVSASAPSATEDRRDAVRDEGGNRDEGGSNRNRGSQRSDASPIRSEVQGRRAGHNSRSPSTRRRGEQNRQTDRQSDSLKNNRDGGKRRRSRSRERGRKHKVDDRAEDERKDSRDGHRDGRKRSSRSPIRKGYRVDKDPYRDDVDTTRRRSRSRSKGRTVRRRVSKSPGRTDGRTDRGRDDRRRSSSRDRVDKARGDQRKRSSSRGRRDKDRGGDRRRSKSRDRDWDQGDRDDKARGDQRRRSSSRGRREDDKLRGSKDRSSSKARADQTDKERGRSGAANTRAVESKVDRRQSPSGTREAGRSKRQSDRKSRSPAAREASRRDSAKQASKDAETGTKGRDGDQDGRTDKEETKAKKKREPIVWKPSERMTDGQMDKKLDGRTDKRASSKAGRKVEETLPPPPPTRQDGRTEREAGSGKIESKMKRSRDSSQQPKTEPPDDPLPKRRRRHEFDSPPKERHASRSRRDALSPSPGPPPARTPPGLSAGQDRTPNRRDSSGYPRDRAKAPTPLLSERLNRILLHRASAAMAVQPYGGGVEEGAEGGSHTPYVTLLMRIMEIKPQSVVKTCTSLLRHLRLYDQLGTFQAAAYKLLRGCPGSAPDGVSTTWLLQGDEVSSLVSSAACALNATADILRECRRPYRRTPALLEMSESLGAGLPKAPDLHPPSLLHLVTSRQLLPTMAAVLHAPRLLAQVLQDGRTDMAAAAQHAAALQGTLLQPLLIGVRALMTELFSTPTGFKLVTCYPEHVLAIAEACEPIPAGADPLGALSNPRTPLAAGLCTSLLAGMAVETLTKSLVGSRACVQAIATLMAGCLSPQQRSVFLQSLAYAASSCVSCLLRVIKHGVDYVLGAGTNSSFSAITASTSLQSALPRDSEGQSVLAATYAALVLQTWLREGTRDLLQGNGWVGQSSTLQAGVGGMVAALKDAADDSQGIARLVTVLQEAAGCASSGQVAASQGVSGLMAAVDAAVPKLPVVGEASSTADKKAARSGTVDSKQAIALVYDIEKCASVTCALQLLCLFLEDREHHGNMALMMMQSDSTKVLERLLLTAVVLLSACAADEARGARAGHAYDTCQLESLHLRVMRWTSATAELADLFLQQVVQFPGVQYSSKRMLDALVTLHRLLSTTRDSLTAAVVGTADASPALQARCHIAAACRHWLEGHSWTPKLLPVMFNVKPGSGAHGVDPSNMLPALNLLADLCPPEWPAVTGGARRAPVLGPPSHRRYRAALANSLEPVTDALTATLTCAVASDSALFRCQLVRVCAKAAGLGGGMGTFVSRPLVARVQAIGDTEPDAPGDKAPREGTVLQKARRVLEVLVPLVYRPAIKAAMLSLCLLPALAQLLRRLAVYGSAAGILAVGRVEADAKEAAALHGMALECAAVLLNPDYALNPLNLRSQRLIEDTPPPADVAPLVTVLLDCLPAMNAAANLVKRVLHILAGHTPGQRALGLGVRAWYQNSSEGAQGGVLGQVPVQQALAWAVPQLLEQGENSTLKGNHLSGAASQEIAQLLDSQAAAITEAVDNDEPEPEPAAAAVRFVAALQSALTTDGGAIDRQDAASCPVAIDPCAPFHDPAVRAFWRNITTRKGAPVPYDLVMQGVRIEAVTPSQFAKMQIDPSSGTAQGLLVHDLSAMSDIPSGLAVPKYPSESKRRKRMVGGESGINRHMQEEKRGPSQGPRPPQGPALVLTKGLSGDAGADIPTIKAPSSSRGKEGHRRGSGSSRASSMHVDVYEKKTVGGAGPGPAGGSGTGAAHENVAMAPGMASQGAGTGVPQGRGDPVQVKEAPQGAPGGAAAVGRSGSGGITGTPMRPVKQQGPPSGAPPAAPMGPPQGALPPQVPPPQKPAPPGGPPPATTSVLQGSMLGGVPAMASAMVPAMLPGLMAAPSAVGMRPPPPSRPPGAPPPKGAPPRALPPGPRPPAGGPPSAPGGNPSGSAMGGMTIQQLISNPAALQALCQDQDRLKRVMAANPALVQVLKDHLRKKQ